MKFFIDSASLEDIRRAAEYGVLDGVTTNPSLLAKEKGDWKKNIEAICKEVSGPVSVEVIGLTREAINSEARELVRIAPQIVIKVPVSLEGLKAIKDLRQQNIPTNATLIFSPLQALMAAKAGAAYVSPFVGRLDDIGQNGMEMVSQILSIWDRYAFETEIIVASIRNPIHVLESATMGADIVTVPLKVIKKLLDHPLTDSGLEKFLLDYEQAFGHSRA